MIMEMNNCHETIKKKSCWHRRNQLERALLVLIGNLVLAIVGLSIALHYESKVSKPNICSTPICISEANNILSAMNKSVNPCDDFYEFACGNYMKGERIPDDEVTVELFTQLRNKVARQLRDLLEDDSNKTEIRPFQLAKQYYKTCMNTKAIELNGLVEMQNIIALRLGGWPVLQKDWDPSTFDWKQLMYRFRLLGMNYDLLIKIQINNDYKNSSKYSLILDQPSFGLSKEFLKNGRSDKLVKAYYNYMVDVATMFGANRTKAIHELSQSLDFEIKLANIAVPRENRRDFNTLYNVMTITELQSNFTTIPWLYYLKNVISLRGTALYENDTVIVAVPKYFNDLELLLQQTPNRTLANYLIWRNVKMAIPYLTDALQNRKLEYDKAKKGKQQRRPRWMECIGDASDFKLAISALYVRKYFNDSTKKNGKEMVDHIRLAFNNNLEELTWLDAKTKEIALEKLKALSENIGYPEELLDDKKLIAYYKNYKIDTKSYLLSSLNVSRFYTNYEFSKLRQKVKRNDWRELCEAYMINAQYNPWENSIDIPVGILQAGFYNNHRPNYLNFGAIGSVIGHEITHGFDDQGRLFDKNGNLADWWSQQAKLSFNKEAQCFIQQYGNYTIPQLKIKLNGITTQGENIADNGGFKVAYEAYNKWVSRFGHEPMLPGLDYTSKQLFWISVANTWCAKVQLKEVLQITKLDSHAYPKFRVIGPLSNNKEFSEDFNCPKGSNMNPVNKCNIW